jgi:hypothetical protein
METYLDTVIDDRRESRVKIGKPWTRTYALIARHGVSRPELRRGCREYPL